MLTISFDLLSAPTTVRWAGLKRAFAVFLLSMEETSDELSRFAGRMRATMFRIAGEGAWQWTSPAGVLGLGGATAAGPIADQDRGFHDSVNGEPILPVRLSDVRFVL
jgi:hypothetical protein